MAGLLGFAAAACAYDWTLADDPTTPPACVRYVVAGADPAAADGLTWSTAYADPQAAIHAAAEVADAQHTCEVWVAAGTYYVHRGSRESTLALAAHVSVYGGFVGQETLRSERDWQARATVLDGREAPGGAEGVFHVVTGTDAAILDGFTVTYGQADGDQSPHHYGGGMLNQDVSPTVRNCTFNLNHADQGGGAMANIGGAPTLSGCRFLGNSAASGGAIYSRDAVVVIESGVFYDNQAAESGGALANSASATLRVTQSVFVENSAGQQGGSILNSEDAFLTVANSILWDNHADDDGHGIAGSAELHVSYSVVQKGLEGEGILDAKPKFVDQSSGDFRLKQGSPCIDAADGAQAPELDLAGNPRVDDPAVDNTGVGNPAYADIGAYEFQPDAPSGDGDE